jgi:hypothetical protein
MNRRITCALLAGLISSAIVGCAHREEVKTLGVGPGFCNNFGCYVEGCGYATVSDMTLMARLFNSYDFHYDYGVVRIGTAPPQPRAGDLLDGDLSGLGPRTVDDLSRNGAQIRIDIIEHDSIMKPVFAKLTGLGCFKRFKQPRR